MRFVYICCVDWYLSLESKRDVLEQQRPHEIDLSGWDLQKALKLFAKSNPPLLEWLGSPIVYREEQGFTDALKGLLPSLYAPRACMYRSPRSLRQVRLPLRPARVHVPLPAHGEGQLPRIPQG